MNAKITLLLALAAFAISAAHAQYYDNYGYDSYGYDSYGHDNYHGGDYQNKGPNNVDYDVTKVQTGVQEAENVKSTHASNKNQGYNIAGKSQVENEQNAQLEKGQQQYQPYY